MLWNQCVKAKPISDYLDNIVRQLGLGLPSNKYRKFYLQVDLKRLTKAFLNVNNNVINLCKQRENRADILPHLSRCSILNIIIYFCRFLVGSWTFYLKFIYNIFIIFLIFIPWLNRTDPGEIKYCCFWDYVWGNDRFEIPLIDRAKSWAFLVATSLRQE